ncbi:MAG: hypothetical protein H0T73_06775 [Ardenticatenales bacterium]|nr:hypothetical protein [Ardenticatenales bacterium]
MQRAVLIADESLWARGHPSGHPLRPERLRDTWQMLLAYEAFRAPGVGVLPPRLPTEAELAFFHTPAYIEVVRRLSQGETVPEAARYGFGPGDNPPFVGMFESESRKVGAGLVGAEALLAGESQMTFSFAGGLHHAGRELASGFCVFGDCAG